MLTIDLRSFGFRQSGIPKDPSEHGGGFVFDCRFLPNPGQEDAYKSLTGLDKPVKDYLKTLPEVHGFHEHCLAMIRSVIHSYLKRGYDRIMVSYGCTGGQHRSVFPSEHLRTELLQDPDLQGKIQVTIKHMERGNWLNE